jgi:hypothetical protein
MLRQFACVTSTELDFLLQRAWREDSSEKREQRSFVHLTALRFPVEIHGLRERRPETRRSECGWQGFRKYALRVQTALGRGFAGEGVAYEKRDETTHFFSNCRI